MSADLLSRCCTKTRRSNRTHPLFGGALPAENSPGGLRGCVGANRPKVGRRNPLQEQPAKPTGHLPVQRPAPCSESRTGLAASSRNSREPVETESRFTGHTKMLNQSACKLAVPTEPPPPKRLDCRQALCRCAATLHSRSRDLPLQTTRRAGSASPVSECAACSERRRSMRFWPWRCLLRSLRPLRPPYLHPVIGPRRNNVANRGFNNVSFSLFAPRATNIGAPGA